MNKKEFALIFKTSFKHWRAHNAPISAAALTFFIILPLPSLLLIVAAIFSLFYGQTIAQQQIIQEIISLAGPSVAQLFQQLLESAMSPFASLWVAITVVAFSVGGAIGAFAVLRNSMDAIWDVKAPKKLRLADTIKEKIGPFVIVSILGLILIAWTAVASLLFRAIAFYSINEMLTSIVVGIVQILISFAVSATLFALSYKMIPQAKVHWHDVGLAAVTTGIAFTMVNYILGSYLQIFTVTTIVGAAGSLLIILLWIYILNLIMLFGAEISKTYAVIYGKHAEEHLPERAQKIAQLLERVEEMVEEETRGPTEEIAAEEIELLEPEKVTIEPIPPPPQKEEGS